MRTSLFVSTLFAVSLFGGVALADKPDSNVTDRLRRRGEVVDKVRTPERAVRTSLSGDRGQTTAAVKNPLEARVKSRINCSDTDMDCRTHRAVRPQQQAESKKLGALQQSVKHKGPNPLEEKVSMRVKCNEGDECTLSTLGAKALWNKERGKTGSDASTQRAGQVASDRMLNQAYAARMSCNEGEECMMSSKEAQKIWRTEAFKAGTVDPNSKGLDRDAFAAQIEKLKAEKYKH
jgi:hypothetical protein